MPINFILRKKMAELWPFIALVPMWHLAYFGQNIGNFGYIFEDMDFIFVLPITYVKIDGQTNF